MIWFDIEADALLYDATTIWCIVALKDDIYHIYINDVKEYNLPKNSVRYSDLQDYLTLFRNEMLVGHNIISYDLPLLNKLAGFMYDVDISKQFDTHIISRLTYPDREEHSLAYFGELLKFPKGDHKDFSRMSQEMLDYCVRDVDLVRRVYFLLQGELEGWDWDESIKLEYHVWHIQWQQEVRGVLFDVEKAEQLHKAISDEIDSLSAIILSEIPPRAVNKGELKKIFLKNGEYTAPVKEWIYANL